jgi:hypothetical protein
VVALTTLTTACGSAAGPTSTPAATGTTAGPATTGPSATGAASPQGAGTTASAPPPSPSGAGTATVTGAAALALIDKAFRNTQAASSVRVVGQAVATGTGNQTVSFDLTLVKSVGCTGTIALTKAQTFKIVKTQDFVWLLPRSAFYASLHLDKAAIALVANKYIRVKANDKQVADLTTICTSKDLFGALPKPSGTGYRAVPTTYNGAPAYAITQAGKPGTAIISNSAAPLLLQLTDPSTNGGTITFLDYNAVSTITPPSDAESIDGSQLGI